MIVLVFFLLGECGVSLDIYLELVRILDVNIGEENVQKGDAAPFA